jgi:hypothetical protein
MSSDFENFVTGEMTISWRDRQALNKEAAARQARRSKLEKTAALSGFLAGIGRSIAKGIPMAATAATAGIGVQYALRGHESLVGAIQKGRAFKRLLKSAPDLAELPADKLREQFGTLYRFSPDVAKTPRVAASWIRQVNAHTIEGQEFIPPETIKDLVTIQKGMSDIRSRGIAAKIPEAIVGGVMKAKAPGNVIEAMRRMQATYALAGIPGASRQVSSGFPTRLKSE